MRALLLHPYFHKYLLPPMPPLGLLSLAAVLEEDGVEVRLADLNVRPEKFEKELPRPPDLVGITATTPLVKEAWSLASEVKKTGIPVILGGPHASALPEESLEKGIDVIVRGEGEETFKELCRSWPRIESVAGISFKKQGRIVHNPNRPLIGNLDQLPFPAYHLLDDLSAYEPSQPVLTRPRRSLNILTSRGCPFQCNYCFKGIFGPRWRAHSASYVVALWEKLVREYGAEEIGVADDNFNLDPTRVEAICDGLLEKNLRIPWMTNQGIRADKITLPLLEKMHQTGFFRTGFGVEAGSQEMITRIGKNLDLEKVYQAVRFCREVGIESIGYFIIGNAYDDQKAMEETIELAMKLDPDAAHFTIAVPFPSTPLYSLIKREGKLLIDDWSKYGYTRGKCYFEAGDLKKDLVERMWRRAYRRFYLRPKIIARFLRRKDTWLNLPKLVRAGLWYSGIIKN